MDKPGKRKLARYENVKDAYIQQTKSNKLILHISLSQHDMDELCLERGEVPKDIFKIVIHRRGEF